MNLYMDIDGVLLTKDQRIPADASNLVRYAIKHFNCYWLTTHCRTGTNRAVESLSRFYTGEDLSMLNRFRGTDWNNSKTEAINWSEPFVWLEDWPFNFEIEQLKRNDCYDSLVQINLTNENELSKVIRILDKKIYQFRK